MRAPLSPPPHNQKPPKTTKNINNMNGWERRQRLWAHDYPKVGDIQLAFGKVRSTIHTYADTPDSTLENIKEAQEDLDELRADMQDLVEWMDKNLSEMSTEIDNWKDGVVKRYKEQVAEIERNKKNDG